MALLFVDTHGERGGLAILEGNGDLFLQEWTKKSSHSEVITTEFQQLLAQAGRDLKDLQNIAINQGPGSFTGLRVGISFAKSLAYLLKVPALVFNTLEVMAFTHGASGKVLATLPAIRGHCYAAGYQIDAHGMREILEPASQTEEQIDGLKKDFEKFVDGALEKNRTDVQDVIHFYQQRSKNFKETLWDSVKPLYLRRSQAEEKLRSGLLKPIYGESEQHIERKRGK